MTRIICMLAACAALSAPAWAQTRSNPAPGPVEAVTKPGADVTLAFVRPGKIAELKVKDGQPVKAGELLVKQDDTAEQAKLQELTAQAGDKTKIQAAEAKLAQTRVQLKKLEEAARQGAAAVLEVENAKLEVVMAELSLQLAKFDSSQDELKRKEVALELERMKIVSPIAGRVEKTFLKEGESVDSLKEVIRIVDVTTLWAEAYIPRPYAIGLRPGKKLEVRMDRRDGPAVMGTVLHVAAVADAASETVMVRVEVANPQMDPAGGKVYVSLTEPGVAAADGAAGGGTPK